MSKSPIGRKLAMSFAVVSVLAAAQCVAHVLLIARVGGTVTQMQEDEKAISAGLELAKAVREQYIHAAHNIAQGDDSHLDHYGKWATRVGEAAKSFGEVANATDRPRIAQIVDASREFDRVFRSEILPAVQRGDTDGVRRAHVRVEALLGKAAHDADALASHFERKMSHAHVSATEMTHFGIALAALGIMMIVAVAALSTVHIQRAVIEPLSRLSHAATEIGRGHFRAPVEGLGDGEFHELGLAFDRMTSELHRREAQLVQSERMAAIGQIAAGIAHEINNPIGIIRGYLRTMLPETRDEGLRDELRILDEEAAACQRITEDLLAYARLPELKKGGIAMDALLEDVVHRFASTSEGQRVRIEIKADRGTLQADEVRLRQVLNNLIKNAVEAGTKEIALCGELQGSEYAIRVLDRGTGIREEDRSRIFEPFYSSRRGGTGLGLAVCLGIVHAHGGTITAVGRDGGGTELRVSLPLDAPPAVLI